MTRARQSIVVPQVVIIRVVVAVLIEATAAADHLTFADWASRHVAADVMQAARGHPAIVTTALEPIRR
ncbi:MAG TPA: hypothetical protein VF711_04855 [Acidimicrobiales bacterium]